MSYESHTVVKQLCGHTTIYYVGVGSCDDVYFEANSYFGCALLTANSNDSCCHL